MSVTYHGCKNPECDVITAVQHWPARVDEPAGSTAGDGCDGCGEELGAEVEGPEPDYEAMEEARLIDREHDRKEW